MQKVIETFVKSMKLECRWWIIELCDAPEFQSKYWHGFLLLMFEIHMLSILQFASLNFCLISWKRAEIQINLFRNKKLLIWVVKDLNAFDYVYFHYIFDLMLRFLRTFHATLKENIFRIINNEVLGNSVFCHSTYH